VVTITGIFYCWHTQLRRGEDVNDSSRNHSTSDNISACRIYFAVGVSDSQPESLDVLPEVEETV
jgi:hypothetical protein